MGGYFAEGEEDLGQGKDLSAKKEGRIKLRDQNK